MENSRNKQLIIFKLCSLLSTMIKSCPAWYLSHPFVQLIHSTSIGKKQYIQGSVLFVVSGIHLGHWNVYPVYKGRPLCFSVFPFWPSSHCVPFHQLRSLCLLDTLSRYQGHQDSQPKCHSSFPDPVHPWTDHAAVIYIQ